jgi:hypothetical protein
LTDFKSTGIWPCNRHEFQDEDFCTLTLVVEESLRINSNDISNKSLLTNESKETREEGTAIDFSTTPTKKQKNMCVMHVLNE